MLGRLQEPRPVSATSHVLLEVVRGALHARGWLK